MTRSEILCDRCGKPMVYEGWTGMIKRYPKRIFLRKLFNGNPDGYSYSDHNLDLCRDCCKSFHKWVESGRDPRGESHENH